MCSYTTPTQLILRTAYAVLVSFGKCSVGNRSNCDDCHSVNNLAVSHAHGDLAMLSSSIVRNQPKANIIVFPT